MKRVAILLILFILISPLFNELCNAGNSYVKIVKPKNGVYLMDKKIFPIIGQVVIGGVTVKADASDDIKKVEFMVAPKVGCRPVEIYNVTSPPYSFYWNFSFAGLKDEGFMALKARGYDGNEYVAEDDIFLVRIFV